MRKLMIDYIVGLADDVPAEYLTGLTDAQLLLVYNKTRDRIAAALAE